MADLPKLNNRKQESRIAQNALELGVLKAIMQYEDSTGYKFEPYEVDNVLLKMVQRNQESYLQDKFDSDIEEPTNTKASTNWIEVSDKPPLAYKTGDFDGKQSDRVLAEGRSGKIYLATYYEGVMDGFEFKDWYESPNDFEIREPIIRYLEIAD